jgi:hypothetical protein
MSSSLGGGQLDVFRDDPLKGLFSRRALRNCGYASLNG